MAIFNVNISAAAITAAIAAETAARISGDAASVSTAAADATSKANAAQAAAIASAATDATTKANAAQAAAIAAAATDATTKANAAQAAAISAAATDATTKANAAEANAIAAAATDATTKANAAQAASDPVGSAATVQGNLDAHVANTTSAHGVQLAVMSGDATSTVVTLADVGNGLTATLPANKKFFVEVVVVFRSAATTTGIGLTLNGSTAATMVNGRATYFFSQTQQTNYNIRAYDDFATSAGIDATGTNARASIDAEILNGASVSTLNVRFASEINASQITVEADGTYMRVTQMN